MTNINIPIPDDLKALLESPKCVDLSLPKFKTPSITLPTGSKLKGLADVSKGIPTDCSVTFSLLLQIGPILASMECLLKLLKAVGTIIKVVKDPTKVLELDEVLKDIAQCLAIPTGANLPIFVKDILCLIVKMLKCAIGSLKSVAQLMQGLTLSLDAAEKEGNEDLIATLKCLQANASTQAESVLTSIEPLAVLLELAGPVMDMAQIGPVSIPTIGSANDAESLLKIVEVLEGVVETIDSIVGGC
jgi:hypothetical protein